MIPFLIVGKQERGRPCRILRRIAKGNSIDRTVAPQTGHPAEQGIPRHLSRDGTSIQLKHDPVRRHHPQVVGISHPPLRNAQVESGTPESREQVPAMPPLVIHDGDGTRMPLRKGNGQRHGVPMVARRDAKLPCPDENPRALRNRP